jgi:glutamyl-tRNA synthetase
MNPVRVRFAPSPTGALHIGGVRTALYNYLFAKQNKGTFILRIEDTDQTRYVPGAEEYILESLRWTGLIPDEGLGFGGPYGPYRQSERKAIYLDYAKQLIHLGYAYYAFDTTDEIEEMKKRLASESNPMPKYDYHTRTQMKNSLTRSAEEVENLFNANTPWVIRLKVPPSETVSIVDKIRGEVNFNSEELDDKVLIKSDGMPTYHMANVIDDRLMKITHVIRGEEWLSSTAHHVLLYRFFGWEAEMPEFAHLPLILKPNGNGKLSKRDGAQFGFPVFPLDWKSEEGEIFSGFREAGFLPGALINFLVLLGWNPGTEQEIFSMDELIQMFSLEKIIKSGARFDYNKAKWFNSTYIQKEDFQVLQNQIKAIFSEHELEISEDQLKTVYHLYKDRAVLVTDFFHMGKYIVLPPSSTDDEFKTKKWKREWADAFINLANDFKDLKEWNHDSLEAKIKEFMNLYQMKMGEVLPSIRVMLSGTPMGPDVYQMLMAVGKEKSIERIYSGVQQLSNE